MRISPVTQQIPLAMRERKRGDRRAVNSMLRTIKPSVNPLRERIGNLTERLLQFERKTENIQRGDYLIITALDILVYITALIRPLGLPENIPLFFLFFYRLILL